MLTARRHNPTNARPRGAFTLVELLVVVVIMLIVMGIVVVAGSSIVAESRRANTQRLMGSIANALEMFKADHGYYPPLLSHSAGGNLHVPEAQSNAFTNFTSGSLFDTRYHSVYSLAAYLIGVGDLAAEGGDFQELDGVQGPGLRSPGLDRAWGGALTGLNNAQRPTTGRVYGPYVDVASGRNMRQVRNADVIDSNNAEMNVRFTLVDRWGTPIRYYRYWPTRDGTNVTLANSPLELFSASVVPEIAGASVTQSDRLGVDAPLLNAPYALLSAGSDTFFGNAVNESPGPGAQQHLRLRDFPGRTDEDQALLLRRLSDNIRVTP